MTKTILIMCILALTILSTALTSCTKNDMGKTDETPNISGVNTSSRTEAEELDFMRTKSKSLTQNAQGHWEADLGNGIVMIYVPEATFTLGKHSPIGLEASPQHQVTLSHYWISKTPVTKGQFRAFVTASNYVTEVEKPGHPGPFVMKMPEGTHYEEQQGFHWENAYDHILAAFPAIGQLNDNHPVSCVSWNDAIAYTNWLKEQNGLEFSLPTEAEWEYAARGTDGRAYPWGNEVPDGTRANYADESLKQYFPNLEQAIVHNGVNDGYVLTSPVGSFPAGASPIGALDMAGNLTEWVFDAAYDYTASSKTNPISMVANGQRQMKAGFWSGSAGREGVTPDELADGHNIRSEARQSDDQNSADDHLGFRIAISYTVRN